MRVTDIMPLRIALTLVFIFGWTVTDTSLKAQGPAAELISADVAARFGLERAWYAQVSIDPARGSIQNLAVHVSSTKAQKVYEVETAQGVQYVVSERNLGLWGEPIGAAGARKAAEQRLLAIKEAGGDGKVVEKTIPDILVVATTDTGLVQMLDGETGESHWATRIGHRSYPTSEPAVTDKYVAVINGTVLYVMDAEDGKLIWQHRTQGVTSRGPAISGDYVFAPKANGNTEAYSVAPDAPSWPEIYRANGAVSVQPVAIGNRVVIGTDAGDLSVLTAGDRGVKYRIRTGSRIVGGLSIAYPTQLVAITGAGQAYSFDIRDGDILWRFASGEDTRQPAAVVGQSVFLLSQHEGVYCLERDTGMIRWSAANERQFIAATDDRVFFLTRVGNVNVLDIQSGRLLGTIPTPMVDHIYSNVATDRIYVANRSGLIQCLHVAEHRWPTIHLGDKAVPAPTAPQTPAAAPVAAPAPAATNPFGTDTPPAGAAPPAADANPFGPPPAAKPSPKKDDGKATGNPFG